MAPFRITQSVCAGKTCLALTLLTSTGAVALPRDVPPEPASSSKSKLSPDFFSPSFPARWELPQLSPAQDARPAAPHGLRFDEAELATVVVFLSARCPCSRSHETKLRALALAYPRFRFVGIHSNADEPEAQAATHFREAQLGFTVLQDPQSRLADGLGALKTPHAYVIDPRGKILFEGGVDDSQIANHAKRHFLKAALDDVLAAREVREPQARALGCLIRRPGS
jgi:hypothetical protein